jgi:hypothetical protein
MPHANKDYTNKQVQIAMATDSPLKPLTQITIFLIFTEVT